MDLLQTILARFPEFSPLKQPPETFLAALISAVATIALIAGFMPRQIAAQPRPRNEPQDPDSDSCDFMLNGGSVKALSSPARVLLQQLGGGKPSLTAIKQHLLEECPGIDKDIEALVLEGQGFRHHFPRGDGTALEVLGEPRGNATILSIRPASEDARALQHARANLERARREIAFLRRVIDKAPVLAWNVAPDNQVTWANAPYHERFDPITGDLPDHRIADAFGHAIENVPLTSLGAGVRARKLVSPAGDTEPQWYEVTEIDDTNGHRLIYALDTNELVAAEASLRRFVETLTETFAHLPIGLAVFDKNRRLGLFNPALTELVKIDAVWLAGRPSLRDFLERLRETRQMPEQKDFAAWRRKLGELEEGARHGTYEENWILPSGKVFRVTGRPHPQGALAFLFEDISANITLERKYRSELELSQATLDKLNEAVAVFNASGSLVFVNTAFESLWDLDPMHGLQGPTITDLAATWAQKCQPNPVWSKLAEFATAEDARTTWSDAITTRDGRNLQILVAPLPDASALVVFRTTSENALDSAEAGGPGGDMLAEFAFEQIRMPAETAIEQVLSAIPVSGDPGALKDLNIALQVLRDALSRSHETRELARNSAVAGDAPLPALAATLADRGLVLDAPAEARHWNARMRSSAMALGLAVADSANPGSTVSISVEAGETSYLLTVAVEATNAQMHKNSQSVAIARRVVSAGGGEIEVVCSEEWLALEARLPRVLSPAGTSHGAPLAGTGSA
jgi:PAS domain-containing protein